MHSEEHREGKGKKNEQNLREMEDTMKCTNILIMEVPEEENNKKNHIDIFLEIIAENFPN